MGSGLGMGDIHQLTEQHQFVLLLLAQTASIVSMFLLYRSSPKKPGAPDDLPGTDAPKTPPDSRPSS